MMHAAEFDFSGGHRREGGREISFPSSPTGPVWPGPRGLEGWTPAELPLGAALQPAVALCGVEVG